LNLSHALALQMKPFKDSKISVSSTAGPKASEIFPLTGLRFVAAFYVFLFHIQIRWPLVGRGALENLLAQGAVGMSFFSFFPDLF
jgi:peptidoglycan/LPS O-acetylase OafA/YrhL